MSKILLATSIAPFEIENQRKAINSWIEAGFDVISCNSVCEIEQVKDFFSDVRFVPLVRDGAEILGKPYPYAYDILMSLKSEDITVCGIINSDIHLVNFTQKLYDLIYDRALNGAMVYGNRMETSSLKECDINKAYSYRGGFDFFVFNKDLINIYQDDGMFIGNTLWDFWFLGISVINGIKLTEVKNPVFYHISHKIRWNETLYAEYNKQLSDKYPGHPTFPYMMMALVVDLHNGIVSEHDFANEKSILVCFVEDDNIDEDTLLSIRNQTHQNVDVFFGAACSEAMRKYDYVFYPANNQKYVSTTLSVMLCEAEKRNAGSLQCDVALVGGDNENDSSVRYIKTISSREKENVLIKVDNKNNDDEIEILHIPLAMLSIVRIIFYYVKELGSFYIYPAGEMSKWFVANLSAGETKLLLGLCDKNSRLWEESVKGHLIYPPDRLVEDLSYDSVLITSQFEEEIYNELKQKIPNKKIFRLSEILNKYMA